MSEEPAVKKPRSDERGPPQSETDPLSEVLEAIQDGMELDKFKSLVNCGGQSSEYLQLFKDRLMMKEVPEGQSPLVAAVLNNRPEGMAEDPDVPPREADILRFILKEYPVNIEQEITSTKGLSVTALWVACSHGNVECVKLLVEYGADVNHECTQSGNETTRVSPLWEVINYYNKIYYIGWSRKNYSDFTTTIKLLADAGARNTTNDSGLSVVVYLAVHISLVDYLIEAFQCGPREIYDVYCMQAALKCDSQYVLKAVQVRLSHPDLFSDLPPADEIYDGIQEPATMADYTVFEQRKWTTMWYYVFSIYCERVQGKNHHNTIQSVYACATSTLKEGNYNKCIQFCQRYLDLTPPKDFTNNFERVLLTICEPVKNGYIVNVQPFFQRALKVCKEEVNKTRLISLIAWLVAVWIKVADKCITDSMEQEREHTHIKKAVQELINATGNNGSTIIADFFDPYGMYFAIKEMGMPWLISASTYEWHRYLTKLLRDLPVEKVLVLLLDHGCSIQCRGKYYTGGFPLHLAMEQIRQFQCCATADCVRTLLKYGSHIDAVDFENKTAKDIAMGLLPLLCKYCFENIQGDGCEFHGSAAELRAEQRAILKEIEAFEPKPPPLQCLSARAIVKYNIEYREHLPSHLTEFVSWHNSKRWY